MKWILVLIGLLFVCVEGFSQDRKIDQLEILYDQGYYQKVLRKANKLLADPNYDYSGLPTYYRSLSLFRLADEPKWRRRHKTALPDAVESYQAFSQHALYEDYVHAHYYEIAALKSYLDRLENDLNSLGMNKDAEVIKTFSIDYFLSIKGKPDNHQIIKDLNQNGNQNTTITHRDKIVEYAKTLVGIKYVWAGADENGFDCSGFTSYVLKKYGITISRTASGQLEDAEKVKLPQVEKGDLVFFGSGAKITHVGMVVNKKGDELAMVHASTSKGVIITNVEQSTYWKPKLQAAGTYLN